MIKDRKITNAMAIPGLKSPDEIASDIWGIHPSLLRIKNRKREVVEARQVLMVYRHKTLKKSQVEAAKPYGKDHATVIHAQKTIKNLLETDTCFTEKYERFYKCVL
jgi:chromosomal replication initiator protein